MSRARDKLRSARVLLDAGEYADSASRAYYAARHALEAILRLAGDEVRSHDGLRAQFGLRYVQTGRVDRGLGRDLRELQSLRHSADYGVVEEIDEADARDALARAERLVAAAEQILTDASI